MWIGEDGFEAPNPEDLIAMTPRLWTLYGKRGQEIPQTEITAIRQLVPAYDRNASGKFKKSLSGYKNKVRRIIGERALFGKFDMDGHNIGPMVMEVILGWKDAHILSITMQMSEAMNFTLGGYNLKEQTALAIQAEDWLVEMRGHKSKKDIARRRLIEGLVDYLFDFLVEKREENKEVIKNARHERALRPFRQEISRSLLKEPPFEVLLSELLQLEVRISETWRFLKDNPSSEVAALFEVYEQIPAFEKALEELATRNAPYGELTDEEEEWKEETENQIASFRRRADYLWSVFNHSHVREIDSVLSAQRELEAQGGGVS